jgi:hypothetical protein
VADLHHPDVEQCPDPDPHQIENFDPDPHPCEEVMHTRLYSCERVMLQWLSQCSISGRFTLDIGKAQVTGHRKGCHGLM